MKQDVFHKKSAVRSADEASKGPTWSSTSATTSMSFWQSTVLLQMRRSREDFTALLLLLTLLNWRLILATIEALLKEKRFLISSLTVASLLIWLRSRSPGSREKQEREVNGQIRRDILSPRLFESLTTHTRLFPKTHSFSYSYLLGGIPVSAESRDQEVCIDVPIRDGQRKGWFSVHAEDYLERGIHTDGFAGKLRDYLSTQNVSFEDYPYAYLLTAPRFLAFAFNPVSFWYLYDQEKKLSAMILEVNNTFDERRMYYLKREPSDDNSASSKFTNAWPKDFHVSPFNDREGSYSLTAADPTIDNKNVGPMIDNTIVLKSNDDKPKIVARIFSTLPGHDPLTMSKVQLLSFILRWWWVGFMTNPRILREARVLWVKKLQLFYRPEVLQTSIGRNETSEEASIEPFFRAALGPVAASSGRPIRYVPAAGPHRAKPVLLPGTAASASSFDTSTPPIQIRILTPAFYSEVVRDPHLLSVFTQHCFEAGEGQAMVHVSDVPGLRGILAIPNLHFRQSESAGLLKSAIRSLRRYSPTPQNMAEGPVSPVSAPSDDPKHDMNVDSLVKSVLTANEVAEYERTCLRILLADRISLGSTALLRFYVRLLWFILLFSVARDVSQIPNCTYEIGFCRMGVALLVKLVLVAVVRRCC